MEQGTCAECGSAFEVAQGRGRPRKFCRGCRPVDARRRPQPVASPRVIECAHCGGLFEAHAVQKYCSSRCRDASYPRVPCAVCGSPTGYKSGTRTHRECRPAVHGTTRAYRKGCRCDECRGAKNAEMRIYLERYKERTGESRWARGSRPSRPKATPTYCADCGKLLTTGPNRRNDPTTPPRCWACGQARRGRFSPFGRKWRDLSRKQAKAAQGSPANPRWAFVAGTCAWCGEAFTRRGAASAFCSKSCSGKHRRRRDRSIRFRGQWISDADRFAIYERDNWTCQLCFQPVDRTAHYLDDKAPTLDHIECQSWVLIPDHSPRNLRLACRRCNYLRGDESWPAVPAIAA